MAKNKSRKNRPEDQAKPNTETQAAAKDDAQAEAKAAAQAETKAEAEAQAERRENTGSPKKRNILYQVKTKRDSGVIKAYITFTYRVLHPRVSSRLVIYGILVALPGIFFFKDLYWRCFFTGIGVAMILLGFFRQYISLAMTKKNDPDYINGTEFTYNFMENSAEFLRNGERFSKLAKYKDITNFYYDNDYYYLALISRDFFILPKAAFTIGDADEFEEFIYKKSKHTCRWIPTSFSDRMKKRRYARAVASKDLHDKDLFK